MADKKFQGQLSWEKVLCTTREHAVSFLISHMWDILLFSTGIAILICIAYYFLPTWSVLLLGGFCYAVLALIYNYYHHSNAFVITSRRIIKYVYSGLGEAHMKEIRLESIRQISTVRDSLWDHFFKYGNLLVNPWMDAISVRGMALHDEVGNYISWLIDYVNKHGMTDEVRPFVPRKERYALPEKVF